MSLHKGSILLALCFTLICAGCAETHRHLFQRYASQFDEKRAEFRKIAQVLPPMGSVKQNSPAQLSLKPVYDAKSDSHNTEIVMYDQLLDPDVPSQAPDRLDLLLSGDLLLGMQWTGPKDPMSDTALGESAGDMEQTFRKTLATPYLVVLRPVSFTPPVAVDEKTYKPGIADIEGFMVSMGSDKIECSFRFTAQSAKEVEYSYKQGESKEGRLEAFAHSTLFTDARRKLEKILQQTTAGQFDFER